jgi:YggT family protein
MELIIHTIFVAYTFLLFARIIISWFPDWQRYHLARFVAFYTDPYLNLFRKILPPIGGVMDISPILAFFALKIFEAIIMGLIP